MHIVLSPAQRGALLEAFLKWSRCGARGRGETQPTHSGGAGAPPGTTRGACQELAYYPGPKCPEGRAARRRSQNAVMERREAPALSKRECGKTEDWCAARCSIPSILRGGEKGTTAYPAPPRIRAMTRVCTNRGCLKIEPAREAFSLSLSPCGRGWRVRSDSEHEPGEGSGLS
jgi:hypothetical protein